MTSKTATVHPELQLLQDTGRPRVHMVNTLGRRKFPAYIDPPIYGKDTDVVPDIFYQPHPNKSTRVGVQQFSAMLILTLEEWRADESTSGNDGLEDICTWGLQVYPPDNELVRALDARADNGSIMDQLKSVISMMKNVPLVLGCAIILRFGHRGAEYPYMDVETVFDFGAENIRAKVDAEITQYDAYERKPHIMAWRWAQGMFGAKAPKQPTPVGDVPDLWGGNADMQIIRARCESIIASLIRRVEGRDRVRDLMVAHNITPAPGDQNTVIIRGERAERAITAKQIRRAGGVTICRPGQEGNLVDEMMGIDSKIRHGIRPSGLGRASDSMAPPAPPPNIRSVVPDHILSSSLVEIIDEGDNVAVVQPPKASTPNLAIRRRDKPR